MASVRPPILFLYTSATCVRESLRTWPSIYHLGSWHTVTLVQHQSGAVETFPESSLLWKLEKVLEASEAE